VGKPLVEVSLSNFIRTPTLERDLMNAVIVKKLSDKSHPLFFIREFTMDQHAMYVMNVEKFSIKKQALFCTGEFIVERELLMAGRPQAHAQLSVDITVCVLLRLSAIAEHVGKPSDGGHHFYFIREFTEERKHRNAQNGVEASKRSHPLFYIKELERNPPKVRRL
jgi:hypothetical protein